MPGLVGAPGLRGFEGFQGNEVIVFNKVNEKYINNIKVIITTEKGSSKLGTVISLLNHLRNFQCFDLQRNS